MKKLIEVERDSLNFGDFKSEKKQKLKGFKKNEDIYDINSYSESTKLIKNGEMIFEAVPGVKVTNFIQGDDGVTLKLLGIKSTQVTIKLDGDMSYNIKKNKIDLGEFRTSESGKLTLSVDLSKGEKEIEIKK